MIFLYSEIFEFSHSEIALIEDEIKLYRRIVKYLYKNWRGKVN